MTRPAPIAVTCVGVLGLCALWALRDLAFVSHVWTITS
jgi:hypothetical protein